MVQFAIGFGIFISYVANTLLFDVKYNWRWMLGISAVPALVQLLLGLKFLVESPRWLVSKGRLMEATAVVEKLTRKSEKEVKTQIEDILQTISQVVWTMRFLLRMEFNLIFLGRQIGVQILSRNALSILR